METAEDAAPNNGARLHEFTLPRKMEIFTRLGTVWAAHLTPYELTLVTWLLANTISRGKHSGTYSYPQLLGGVPKADGSGMWTGGLRISERMLRNVIGGLRAKGLLKTVITDRGTRFTVVLDWNPETGKAEETNVVSLNLPRARRRAGLTPVQQMQATAEEAAGEWGGGAAAEEPEAPSLPLGDERQSAEVAEAQRAAALKRQDPRAWEITWKAAWADTYVAAGCPGWSMKAVGVLKNAVKKSWPSDRAHEIHAMLEFVVRNWDPIIRKHFSWMVRQPPPEQPDIVFVGTFITRFHEAFASRAELEWLGAQDSTKQAVHALMKRTGMTRETALAHVLAKARESADLVEARKLAAQAKRDREIQILAADRAERATRFTPDNPHPRAHENKRKPAKLADTPIWETEISTPKFGEADPDFVEAEWSVPHLPAVDPNSW